MTGKQRVMRVMGFREPDRVPRFWPAFWPEFVDRWTREGRQTNPHEHFETDIRVVAADETAWPTRATVIREGDGERIVRSGWGAVQRVQEDAHFRQWIEPAITERVDPDTLTFDDPALDRRYEEAGRLATQWKDRYYVFCKTGGPYLRAAFMRSEELFWLDVAEDPAWTKAFVERVADHITSVGVEQLKRFDLQDTGIGIYDDVSANWGPFVGPDRYERLFLPALRRMVKAYKEAGAAVVMHHADGNVLPLLDMWIDAGISAINPVEYRAGMDPVKIRRHYGDRLVCIGGLDNCAILPRGDRAEIRDHVLHLLEAGRGGGFVIGPHSIGPDISIETMDYVQQLLAEYGRYPLPR